MALASTIHIDFDALAGVDGSARFSFDTTTALASVSGPIAARPAAEHPARATIDVHVRPLTAFPGTTEKHAAITALKGVLERACVLAQHPRTLVQIVVQALSPVPAEGAHVRLLAAQINACSLALLNAGSVPMRGVVCAVAVVADDASAGPRLLGAGTASGVVYAGCFAFLFGIGRVRMSTGDVPPSELVWTNYRASPGKSFSARELAEAEEVALEGAAEVWTRMKESLKASSFVGDDLP